MSPSPDVIQYSCRHAPTLERFHQSSALVRGVRGPIGSGKSVACCMELVARAIEQRPDSRGIRQTRFAIVRNTYGELKSTTIKTFEEWLPQLRVVYDAPIRADLNLSLEDGTRTECELLFISIDRPQDAAKMLSLELTGAWINEARELPFEVVKRVRDRCGRYPKRVAASWHGLIMDTNPPDEDHWWYRMAEEETPPGWEFFAQPPAILWDDDYQAWKPNPEAENVQHHHLGYGYWLEKTGGSGRDEILVYLCGQYGTVRIGKPVYPEYNDVLHCAEQTVPFTNLPLRLGFDFGLTPAVAFGQLTPRGRLIIHAEECAEDMGLKQFLELIVVPRLRSEYSAWLREEDPRLPEWARSKKDEQPMLLVTYDPAGDSKGQTDEVSCAQILREYLGPLGSVFQAAPTNSPVARREAVAGFLTRMVDGKPAFQMAKQCRTLRKGFQGKYFYDRVQVSGDERYRDTPTKNFYSHIHDAGQYLALMCGGHKLDSRPPKPRGDPWPKERQGEL